MNSAILQASWARYIDRPQQALRTSSRSFLPLVWNQYGERTACLPVNKPVTSILAVIWLRHGTRNVFVLQGPSYCTGGTGRIVGNASQCSVIRLASVTNQFSPMTPARHSNWPSILLAVKRFFLTLHIHSIRLAPVTQGLRCGHRLSIRPAHDRSSRNTTDPAHIFLPFHCSWMMKADRSVVRMPVSCGWHPRGRL